MKYGKIIFVICFIFLSCFFLTEKGAASAIEPPEHTPLQTAEESMEWKGSISSQKTKYIKFITNNEEWVALWKRAFDKKAPEIDFDNYAVACVFLGYEADWLYSIGFGGPFKRDGFLIVPYSLREIILELAGPFKASGQYRMKVFKKEKGFEMILEEVKY